MSVRAGTIMSVSVLGVGLGALAASRPDTALLVIGAIAVLAAVRMLPIRTAPLGLIGLVLLVPLDSMDLIPPEFTGIPLAITVFAGTVLAVFRSARPAADFVRRNLDVLAWALLLVVMVGFHGTESGLRQSAVLVSGTLMFYWVGLSTSDGDVGKSIEDLLRILAVVGAVQGLLAIGERVGASSWVFGLLPGYHPSIRDFSMELGNRASAWSGHPLRLGALACCGLVAAAALGADRAWPKRVAWLGVSLLSGAGLLLSGARGAWLATVVGLGAFVFMSPVGQRWRAIRVSVGLAVGLGFAAYLSDAGTLITERMFGSASHPLSVGQRLAVLGATLALWSGSPIMGFGFGRYLGQVTTSGFEFSNTESEYVNVLLASGLVGALVFATVMGRTLSLAMLQRESDRMVSVAALYLSWLVLIGTFNAFSWSAATCTVMCIAALIRVNGQKGREK